MSAPEFTPGPYTLCDNEGFGACTIWAGNSPTGALPTGNLLATVHGDSANTEANWHLFGAAPDMYIILERIVDASDRSDNVPSWSAIWDEAKTILAKARGEQP